MQWKVIKGLHLPMLKGALQPEGLQLWNRKTNRFLYQPWSENMTETLGIIFICMAKCFD